MDYVLFGMGYGATLMLLGWALRTFGPERKYKDVNPEDIDRTIAQRRWVRFIQGLGGVIAIAGTSLVLFTFVIMLVNPDDETGSFISMVIWGFLGVAILIWCWFYVTRYGLIGIWSKQEGYGFRNATAVSPSSLPSEGISTARVVSTSRSNEAGSEPASDSGVAAQDDLEIVMTEAQTSLDTADEPIGPFMEEADPLEVSDERADPDPQYDFGDGSDTTVPSEVGGRSEAIRRLRERQLRSGNSTS